MQKPVVTFSSQIDFFKAWLKHPLRVGTFTQSSRFLAESLVKPINFHKAKCIVELGSGTGNVTKKIIEKMAPDCLLFCLEIDTRLVNRMKRQIIDEKIRIIEDSAENFPSYLNEGGFKKADYILSGLPITSLPKQLTRKILNLSIENLNENGCFIQLQYSPVRKKELKKFFPAVKVNFVPLNIPPAFVFVCKRTSKFINAVD